MYVKRDLEPIIEKYLESPEIIAIVGPRQSGKTTLINHIYANFKNNAVLLSFEDPTTLSMFEKDTPNFINLYVKPNRIIFIDEFQYSQNGGKILKEIYDSHDIKIIITGSSSIDLTVKALKYLVGRIFTFELLPFNFREFLKTKDIKYLEMYDNIKIELKDIQDKKVLNFGEEIFKIFKNFFQEYCLYGGYPRVVLSKDYEEKKVVLRNIYSTFFLREVKDYLGLIDDYKLQQLIKALALNTGNLVEYKELSMLSGYSFSSLKRYLNFLEKSYICFLIKPFFKNKLKEIVKNPKVYFLDSGLRNSVINDFRDFKDRIDIGFIIENSIFMQLKKSGYPINYWRDKAKREIDFVINEIPHLCLEIKYNLQKCRASHFIKEFINNYPLFSFVFLYQEGFQKRVQEEANIYKLPCFVVA